MKKTIKRGKAIAKLVDQGKRIPHERIISIEDPDDLSQPKSHQEECHHDWQRDGQTMTAVRWTCAKCGKSELKG